MVNQGRKQAFDLKTWDISAGGAFFDTPEPFSENTRFRIELTVPSERIKELTGAQSCIKVKATVVRSTPTGMAARFDKDYQILSLRDM